MTTIMKKIYAFLMTVITIMTVSCSKEGFNNIIDPEENDSETIKINITFPGDKGTKAAKTAWVAGDKLNIWFHEKKDFVKASVNHDCPDLVITYDGTKWTAGALREGVTLYDTGDNMTLLYEGHNDLSARTFYQWYSNLAWFRYHSNIINDNNVYCNGLTFYARCVNYEFSSNTLTATVSNWIYDTRFKVLIKNDNGEMTYAANNYYLQVQNTTTNEPAYAKGGIVVGHNGQFVTIECGSANSDQKSGGFQEADGIAFYYMGFVADDADVTFTLKDVTGNVVKTYSVKGKTIIGNQDDRCVGVALNYSSFKEVPYFSVSATKKVVFSPGNLQYQASTNTWRFAEHQYDYIGADNSNIASDYTGWIDLFGWGTSGYNDGKNCYQPWSTSTTPSDYNALNDGGADLYSGNGRANWGYNKISNGGNKENSGWRTLTDAEWNYLLFTRAAATIGGVENVRFAKSRLNYENARRGVILFPDNFVYPEGVKELDIAYVNSPSCGLHKNNYSYEEWAKMEAAGAIFLPITMDRNNTTVSISYDGDTWGSYWTSKNYNATNAFYLYFINGSLEVRTAQKHKGFAVRLVRDL